VRVVDCRTAHEYAAGHVPRAVHLGLDTWLKEHGRRGGMIVAASLAAALSAAGIDRSTTVVAYDATGGLYAARLWWVLRAYGHDRTCLLDGGWRRWTMEGRPVQRDVPAVAARDFVAAPRPGLACTLDEVRAVVAEGRSVLLDVRRPDEWTGEDAYGNRRIGHLPGAVHVLWSTLLHDDGSMTFRSREEMRALLARVGVREDRAVVVYCQAAIRAAHTAFVLHLLEHPSFRVYEGSMAEWANRDDTPLVLDTAEPTGAS
jgi:thiosulfate/3-mercaptopyruvate sulfurtransferase